MAHVSQRSLLVLHALRLKGFAEASAVAGATALSVDDVDAALAGLASDELVMRRDGRISGWALTGAGREEHRRRLEEEVRDAGVRDEIDAAYRRFHPLNAELLAVCTAWQMREQPGADPVVNDHRDARYDADVVARLDAVQSDIVPVCDALSGCLARFGPYAPRLANAQERVHAGEVEWLTRPLIDSYHTVWFELHEDLLATLGLERKDLA